MNIIKHMLFVSLFLTGFNVCAMDFSSEEEMDLDIDQQQFINNKIKQFWSDFNFDIGVAANKITDPEQRAEFLNLAYSEGTHNILRDEARKEAKAHAAAFKLMPASYPSKVPHTSPQKPSKTLRVDKKRRPARSKGDTPPTRRRLIMDSETD